MLKLFKRTNDLAVELCERCSQARGTACRAAALRDRSLLQALQFGVRV
jgi:sulfur relay (sulfurtransferase) complex TusBCD TusD component (DsrE family)